MIHVAGGAGPTFLTAQVGLFRTACSWANQEAGGGMVFSSKLFGQTVMLLLTVTGEPSCAGCVLRWMG